MLLIDTYVAPSPIPGAGYGLFSRDFIPAGTVIWRFVSGIDVALDDLPTEPLWRRFLMKYAYRDLTTKQWVLCVDDARFMNHSEQPNTGETSDGGTRTLVDIAPNTELTCDYREFAENPFAGW
jgi:uncharacterized protein